MQGEEEGREEQMNNHAERNSIGNLISSIGILFLFCAFLFLCYNLIDSERAEREALELANAIEDYRNDAEDDTGTTPDGTGAYTGASGLELDPTMEMPEVVIDGIAYIGNLQVPSLGLDLPIISEWSDEYLKIAPCRYSGSIYSDDMVIAAHNYRRHFGDVRWLEIGSQIIFIDMNNNTFYYEIAANEVLEPTQVEEMQESDYDLTLFTCAYNNQVRYAIRCNRVDQTLQTASVS